MSRWIDSQQRHESSAQKISITNFPTQALSRGGSKSANAGSDEAVAARWRGGAQAHAWRRALIFHRAAPRKSREIFHRMHLHNVIPAATAKVGA
jgi:hypothetical protein